MQAFLAAAADEVTSRLASPNATSFSRQHLANFIWAYATLEVGCAACSDSSCSCKSAHAGLCCRIQTHPAPCAERRAGCWHCPHCGMKCLHAVSGR